MGGMVLDTNITDILTHVDAQIKLEKAESAIFGGAPAALKF